MLDASPSTILDMCRHFCLSNTIFIRCRCVVNFFKSCSVFSTLFSSLVFFFLEQITIGRRVVSESVSGVLLRKNILVGEVLRLHCQRDA